MGSVKPSFGGNRQALIGISNVPDRLMARVNGGHLRVGRFPSEWRDPDLRKHSRAACILRVSDDPPGALAHGTSARCGISQLKRHGSTSGVQRNRELAKFPSCSKASPSVRIDLVGETPVLLCRCDMVKGRQRMSQTQMDRSLYGPIPAGQLNSSVDFVLQFTRLTGRG